jgi:hypothetical protein
MDSQALVRVVQSQVFPFETNYFRTAARLQTALTVLHDH